jgi:hypothetical protein
MAQPRGQVLALAHPKVSGDYDWLILEATP